MTAPSSFSRLLLCIALLMLGCQSESKPQPEASASPAKDAVTPAIDAAQQTPNESSAPAASTSDSAASVDAANTGYTFVKPELSEAELRAGWISLFDGSTLFGWELPENANWHVADGSIVADSGAVSLLQTPFTFANFELKCDVHLAAGGNSGIFLRTADPCEDPTTDTYELNICDTHPEFKTGSLVGRHVAEDVPPVEGEWHTFHVVCDGPRIQVQLDGKPIVDFTDTSENQRQSGHIGLQLNKGRVAFRNVLLRPLHGTELFNGTDLSGFRVVPGSQSAFTAREGVIHVESGPGFLETEQTFANFILHVEASIYDKQAIADGRPANSGVFFRAIAGTKEAPSHGYEMQIQHDFVDGDRAQPLDFGTGGIYRREPARYIVADNNQWFVETLIAQGDRFATFVNGYQVLDWADDRPQDPNPRKGLRLEAGHLSLQGHDPTTNLDFRSLRVHELPQD